FTGGTSILATVPWADTGNRIPVGCAVCPDGGCHCGTVPVCGTVHHGSGGRTWNSQETGSASFIFLDRSVKRDSSASGIQLFGRQSGAKKGCISAGKYNFSCLFASVYGCLRDFCISAFGSVYHGSGHNPVQRRIFTQNGDCHADDVGLLSNDYPVSGDGKIQGVYGLLHFEKRSSGYSASVFDECASGAEWM